MVPCGWCALEPCLGSCNCVPGEQREKVPDLHVCQRTRSGKPYMILCLWWAGRAPVKHTTSPEDLVWENQVWEDWAGEAMCSWAQRLWIAQERGYGHVREGDHWQRMLQVKNDFRKVSTGKTLYLQVSKGLGMSSSEARSQKTLCQTDVPVQAGELSWAS